MSLLKNWHQSYRFKPESNETMYAKLKTQGESGGYDVIAPSNYFVSKMAREGMLKLDHSKLPVLKELDPDWLNKPYDKGNKYSLSATFRCAVYPHSIPTLTKANNSLLGQTYGNLNLQTKFNY